MKAIKYHQIFKFVLVINLFNSVYLYQSTIVFIVLLKSKLHV